MSSRKGYGTPASSIWAVLAAGARWYLPVWGVRRCRADVAARSPTYGVTTERGSLRSTSTPRVVNTRPGSTRTPTQSRRRSVQPVMRSNRLPTGSRSGPATRGA